MRAQREHKVLVSSDGADVEQEIVECGGGIDATAVGETLSQMRSYPSAHGGSSAQAGWEFVAGLGLEREAPRVAEQAAALLQRTGVSGRRDGRRHRLGADALQVHESVGHPTELDRVLGFEAAYAGTSFLHPDDAGSLRYGSEPMNITADPTTPAGLGTFAFDDEGVPAAARSRSCAKACSSAGWARARSAFRGSMRADGWSRMPLVRMTNLHLEPGEGTLEELIDGVDERRLPRDEQELVDRRQAPQLPVRHAGRLGDQRRRPRPDVPRRDVHGHHAEVLGLARRRRREARSGVCTG